MSRSQFIRQLIAAAIFAAAGTYFAFAGPTSVAVVFFVVAAALILLALRDRRKRGDRSSPPRP
jgi:membrane protein implicated in regulation of membrane protease activity